MDRIEAEERYVTGDISLSKLAKEAGVTPRTMQKWSSEGKWTEKRQQFRQRSLNKAVTRAVNKRARELEKLILASDEMESALVMAARGLRQQREKDASGNRIANGRFQAGNMQSIANAIGRQIESRLALAGLLAPAENERIKILKKRQRLEEKKAAREEKQDADGVMIQMDQAVEELSE